jgi:hypothetical protein
MTKSMRLVTLAAGLLFMTAGFAQAPAGAPAGSTGLCKDGSYYMGATKKGACRGHKGVKDWYGETAAPAAAAAPKAAPAATAVAAAPAAAASAPTAAAKPAAKSNFTPPATAAAGGGPGQVWVNEGTKVYHCPGDKWYGKTKKGEYMTEAEAKAKGNRPDHGKACQ